MIRRPENFPEHNEWVRQLVEGGKTYFENTGQLQEGIQYFEDLYGKIVGMVQFEDATKAMVANKVGMLAYSGDLYDTCIKYHKLAAGLERDPSYFYNLGLAYRETRMDAELNETLRTLSELPDLDDDHLKLLRANGY